MTKIEHKDGANVELGFTYALDDNGNITRTTEIDGTYWDYEYDGRDRLTTAERNNAGASITAAYAKRMPFDTLSGYRKTYLAARGESAIPGVSPTYDDADNMLTKVEPFFEDFNDSDYTGWTVLSGSWSASSNALLKTDNGAGNVAMLSEDADNEIRFDYRFTDTSTGADYGQVITRFVSGNDYLAVLIAPTFLILASTVSGSSTTLDSESISTTDDQWYSLRIESDGSDVTVWRSTEGELETEVLSSSSAAPSATDAALFGIVNSTMSDSPFEYDNIRILADDLDNTTTFTVNSANQVTAMNDFNGTTNFSYDPWGRMTKKNVSTTYTANYYYNYGSKMTKVTSDFPGEGTVDYEYGGDQKRRQRTAGGVDTWYNWDIGWSVLNEESGTGSGTLQKTYVGRMAEIAGSNPATGTYSYYATDNLGSPRAVYSQAKALVAELNYTPYGQAYTANDTIGITHRYTGHDWDSAAALYFAPYRFYNPQVARWMSRDPLDMLAGTNTYGYVRNRPTNLVDRSGMIPIIPPIGGDDPSVPLPDGTDFFCVAMWLVYEAGTGDVPGGHFCFEECKRSGIWPRDCKPPAPPPPVLFGDNPAFSVPPGYRIRDRQDTVLPPGRPIPPLRQRPIPSPIPSVAGCHPDRV